MVPMRPIGLISDGEVVWREKRSLTAFRDDRVEACRDISLLVKPGCRKIAVMVNDRPDCLSASVDAAGA